ncbi:MAG: biotin carboxylase N-terminal domain-containing protein [Pseudomonadota bacterium]
MDIGRPSFRTILVANRGEIALRVMRTAQRLGYRTVAVYSDADRDAPHRHAADLAQHIGASQPAQSYLDISALIDAARRSGADAVHPGYGFLAEDADFAQACLDAGLVFIGPPTQAMRAMGNKAGAKQLMEAAGVPCVPGYQGEDQSDARMESEAARIGYPVMIKAAAGGGGRGMRRVGSAADFIHALQSARSEARHAFASAELILERAIIEPRHIEIQVFADAHGNVVHLGERDCSVQRRHQKLIEESPSPAVSPELRARMGQVAVDAARAIGYRGAGTLEFLLDRDGHFYFMEMNTRLQVEHAVTEAVTGIDLVEWQLRVADGEPLPLSQAQIDERRAAGGHAIEVRLCAEDPQRDFLPQSGIVRRWRAPPGVRTDHALADGVEVSPYYDSMLAKIVAHGRDRADALRRLAHALERCVLLGVKSNRHFLARCIAHPEFVAGRATTAFIPSCCPPGARMPSALAGTVAALLLAWRRSLQYAQRYPEELRNWSSSYAYPQSCRFTLDGEAVDLPVRALGGTDWEVGDGIVGVQSADPCRLVLALDGRELKVEYVFDADTCHFVLDGVEYVAADTSYAAAERNGCAAGSGRIAAPMNGRIVALPVAVGDKVEAGQVVLVLEAMKMEHSITAPLAGVVQQLHMQPGDQVAPGHLLMEIVRNGD